jgi:signal transduction histidine kinase
MHRGPVNKTRLWAASTGFRDAWEANVTSETARRTMLRALAAPVSAPGWLATISVGWSLVVSSVSFFVLLFLVIFGVPLMLLALVGLPLLWVAFGISRGVAEIERWQAAAFLGADLPLRPWVRQGALPSRMWQRTKSRGSWLELVYALMVRPLASLAGATVVFAAWGGGLAFVLFPLYGRHTTSHGALFGWSPMWGISVLVHVVIGVGLLLAAPWLARGAAAIQVLAGLALLAPNDREQLETRVETLQDTRSRMVAAADAERRRIERDLHDGAQQRLVALAMTLGRAKVSHDPALTASLVSEAHDEAKLALSELRDLARGIHPAVLTDRGLDAALSALAARSPIPVYVMAQVPDRPTPGVEAVAYFIAAEALTNVHKHSGARQAWIMVRQSGDRLQLEVIDDGHGGADFAAGTGLIGLRDRARAIDGELTLSSPPGGPTTIRVELPCGW